MNDDNDTILSNNINKYKEFGFDNSNDITNILFDDFEYNKSSILGDSDYIFFKQNQRKYTNFASNFLYEPEISKPDITLFKNKQNEYNKNTKKDEEIFQYPLEEIHLIKPKININDEKTYDSKTKYYISMIQKLYKINESESFQKLKKFEGNIYKTILLG